MEEKGARGDLSRRGFLRISAAAGAAALLPPIPEMPYPSAILKAAAAPAISVEAGIATAAPLMQTMPLWEQFSVCFTRFKANPPLKTLFNLNKIKPAYEEMANRASREHRTPSWEDYAYIDPKPVCAFLADYARAFGGQRYAIDQLLKAPEGVLAESWKATRHYSHRYTGGLGADYDGNFPSPEYLKKALGLAGDVPLPARISRAELQALAQEMDSDYRRLLSFSRRHFTQAEAEDIERAYAGGYGDIYISDFPRWFGGQGAVDRLVTQVKVAVSNHETSLEIKTLPDGTLQLAFHISADCLEKGRNYGYDEARAIERSFDELKISGVLTDKTQMLRQEVPLVEPHDPPKASCLTVTSSDPAFMQIAVRLCRIDAEAKLQRFVEPLLEKAVREVALKPSPEMPGAPSIPKRAFEIFFGRDGRDAAATVKSWLERSGPLLDGIHLTPIGPDRCRIEFTGKQAINMPLAKELEEAAATPLDATPAKTSGGEARG